MLHSSTRRRIHGRILTCLVIPLLLKAPCRADNKSESCAHRLTTNVDVALTIKSKKSKMNGEMVIDYSLQRKRRELVVSMTSVKAKSSDDGQVDTHFEMRRDRLMYLDRKPPLDVSFKDAPPALQAMMKDSFEAPLCNVQIDESGRELKRIIVAGEYAEPFLAAGLIDNLLLFHPAFSARTNKWKQVRKVSMGPQGFAEGALNYKKVQVMDGKARVRVSGVLSKDSIDAKGGPGKMTNIRYVVSGEQVFDISKKRWSVGKMKINVSLDFEEGGKKIGGAKGTMTLKHESP